MKKLISLITLSFLLSGGIAFAYSDGGAVNNKEQSGGSSADPVRVYQLVRFPENSPGDSTINNAISTGDVVVWDCVSDDGVTVNVAGTVSSTDAVAGVIISTSISADQLAGTSAAADIGKKNWGWMQTYGPCLASAKVAGASTNTAAGQLLELGTGNLVRWGVPVTQGGRLGVPFGFGYDAETTNNSTADVFVRNR